MEDKNNNNDFEQFLRNSIDDFKMIPSRKIWYGIYNNMHPDRKWPSIAVCLIILTAVMFVGVANNNSISSSARRNVEQNLLASTIIIPTEQNKLSNILQPQTIEATLANTKPIAENIASSTNNTNQYTNRVANFNATQYRSSTENNVNNVSLLDEENSFEVQTDIAKENNEVSEEASNISLHEKKKQIALADSKMLIHISGADVSDIDNNFEKNTIAKLNENDTKKSLPKTNATPTEEKLLNEVNVSKNKKHISKLKENGSMNYYITPSVGYRSIAKLTDYKNSSVPSNSFSSYNNITSLDQMKDVLAINVEIGAVLQYKLSNNLVFKTGLQANYTNYISKVTDLGHSTQVSLAASGLQNTSRSSSYNTKEGTTSLNKTTWQVALPIGLDIKIAGNDKLKWYVGGTAQPTYILGGSAFVLSDDARNYISENALLRKWNLNTSIETFVSFKPSANVTLNVGPQFRYQLFSSYKKTYHYSEKLYNVGVKVGLTTNF